jgi:hypothetical protein
MEYTKIYRDLQPVLNKKLRRRELMCLMLGMLGMVLFFFGGWLFAIVPFVILITDFVFKNNINRKGLSLVRAKIVNKKIHSTPISADAKPTDCLGKYCFELDIYESNFFSCIGKLKTNTALKGLKTIKVGERLFQNFEPDTDITLVFLSNKKCVAYLLNGEVMEA